MNLVDGLNDFSNAIAMLVAAIQQGGLSTLAQIIQRLDMGIGQVGDMNVIPDTGFILCGEVGTKTNSLSRLPMATSAATLISKVDSGVD